MKFKNFFKKSEKNIVNKNNKFTAFVDWMRDKIFRKITPFRHLLIWYVSVIIISSLLLITPMVRAEGADPVKWIDALFLSVSSISDTGLTSVVLSESFNGFGQAIALILIQLGGIGWFAIKLFILTLFFRKITHNQVKEVKNELATTGKQETLSIVKVAVTITLGATLIFGLAFGFMFATIEPISNANASEIASPDLVGNWGQAMWTGFFHAGSSINNAGLDIFNGNASLASYYGNIGIQIMTMILFITGGIGFIIIHDLLKYFKSLRDGTKFKFSLLTKISFTSYLVIATIGLGTVYTVEGIQAINNPETSFIKSEVGTEAQNWWALTFNTFSTRNAGFSTIDIDMLSQSSQITYISMMYIGSGPGSTAGGLRTTTVAIIALSVMSVIREGKQVTAFHKQIDKDNIRASFVILSVSLFLVLFSTLLISTTESVSAGALDKHSFLDYLFVVTSAFGTTGLSTFAISDLHSFSKVVLMFMMLVGQLGIITMLKMLSHNKRDKNIVEPKYLKESIPLGH